MFGERFELWNENEMEKKKMDGGGEDVILGQAYVQNWKKKCLRKLFGMAVCLIASHNIDIMVYDDDDMIAHFVAI